MLRTRFQLTIGQEPVTLEEITYIQWISFSLIGLAAFFGYMWWDHKTLELFLGTGATLLTFVLFRFLYKIENSHFSDYEYLNQLSSESAIIKRYFKKVRDNERGIYFHDVQLAEKQIHRERARQAQKDYHETLNNERRL